MRPAVKSSGSLAELRYKAGSWERRRRVIAQGRAHRPGSKPALYRHQPRRGRAGALRPGLLRARGDGKPHQGAAARAFCRPDQLPAVVGQPVPAAALQRVSSSGTLRAGGAPAQFSLRSVGAVPGTTKTTGDGGRVSTARKKALITSSEGQILTGQRRADAYLPRMKYPG